MNLHRLIAIGSAVPPGDPIGMTTDELKRWAAIVRARPAPGADIWAPEHWPFAGPSILGRRIIRLPDNWAALAPTTEATP